MEVKLSTGQRAAVIGDGPNDTAKIRLEDGRETYWPKKKIEEPESDEPELKMVKVPAIDRLKEFDAEANLIFTNCPVDISTEQQNKVLELRNELLKEAHQDFYKKWGL